MKYAFIILTLSALTGSAAHAAVVHPNARLKGAHVVAHGGSKHAVVRRSFVHGPQPDAGGDRLAEFLFGLAPQSYVRNARSSRPEPAVSNETPSDDASPTVDSGSERNDDAAASIQLSNDQAAQDASIAAAEQQNEAAQAAAQQAENNANNN